MSKKTEIEKLGRQATVCNEKGETYITGCYGDVELVRAKLPGTKLAKKGKQIVLKLPKDTRPGFGGTNVLKDAKGEFRVSAVMAGEVDPKDL